MGEDRGERGRQTTAIQFANAGSLVMAKPCSARNARGGGLILEVEGVEHIRKRGFGPARAAAKRGRLIVSRDLDRLPELSKIESAAARDGLPARPLLDRASLAHLPRLS
jgi:hypothetical protein